MDAGSPSAPLGLIAGNGRFPFLVAAAGRRAGRRVVAVAIKEEADPALAARPRIGSHVPVAGGLASQGCATRPR